MGADATRRTAAQYCRTAALCAFAALSLVACGQPATGPDASHIFHGGTILTLADDSASVERLAIGDGRILALGDAGDVETFRTRRTIDVDLDGGVLMPAFVDHHAHLLNIGLAIVYASQPPDYWVKTGGVDSLEQLADRIRRRAETLPTGDWILGSGWSQAAWGSQHLPDHSPLTQAAPEHPVYLSRVDGHVGWLSARGLEVAGIDAATPDPIGGVIRRDARGDPTGVLLERANELVLRRLPQPNDEEVIAAFRAAARALADRGVTEVYDAGFLASPGVVDLTLDQEHYVELLRRADAERPLPLRIHLMVPAPSTLADHILARPAAARRLSPNLDVTHLKLFTDGAMGSRGANLSHPFADDPTTHGVARMTPREVEALSRRALEAGLDVATHAIGDLAVQQVLDVYERLLGELPDLAASRLRIEHLSYVGPGDIERAAALGIALSIQPGFVAPRDDGTAMEELRVGIENSQRVYAWGSLARRGALLAFGSDYFTVPGVPLATYHAAAFRTNASGLPIGGWHTDERLERLPALRLSTRLVPAGGKALPDPALAPGDTADLVVLSDNPLTADEIDVRAIVVRSTWLGGRPTSPAEGGGER